MTATDKPTLPQVLDRFRSYHDDNPAWGSLHVVLEDGNAADEHVKACLEYAQEEGDTEGAALAEILLTMSRTQRLKLSRTV